MKPLNVALVYDRLNKFGGAERVLLALHAIWPDAPLYTAVYDPLRAGWASVFSVHSSFVEHFPFARRRHEWYPWLTPVAFESFSFDEFDVVISVTSAEAKNILTKPGTVHICYCLTPTRYLWSGYDLYHQNPNIGLPSLLTRRGFEHVTPLLRMWDLIGATRPDAYIAISETVSARIKRYYHRSVERVVYPPVDVDMFKSQKVKVKIQQSGDYFLCVSRLVPYKRIDIVVDAFNACKAPLIVIGDGVEYESLVRRAKSNIRFMRYVSDEQLVWYYQNAQALVFAGVEDFGIVSVEAQAAGIPVIAYKSGGLTETVIEGKTGVFFDHQTPSSLVEVISKFNKKQFDSSVCQQNALRFSAAKFTLEMKRTVERVYTFRNKNYSGYLPI